MNNEKNLFKINQPKNLSKQQESEKKDKAIDYKEIIFNEAEKQGFYITIAPTGSMYFYHPKTKKSVRISNHYDPRWSKEFNGTEIVEEDKDIRFLEGLYFFTKGKEKKKYREILEEKRTKQKEYEKNKEIIKEQKNKEAIDFFYKNKEKIFKVRKGLLNYYDGKEQKTWYQKTKTEELLSTDDPIKLYRILTNLDFNKIWKPTDEHNMSIFFIDYYFKLKKD